MGCCCCKAKPVAAAPQEKPPPPRPVLGPACLTVEHIQNDFEEEKLLTINEEDREHLKKNLNRGFQIFLQLLCRTEIEDSLVEEFLLTNKSQIKTFETPDNCFKELYFKGRHCPGLYIILHGQVNLVSDLQFQDEAAVLRLYDMGFFGDVETLFDKPCQTTAHIHGYCWYTLIPTSLITDFILDYEIQVPTEKEWFLCNQYPFPPGIPTGYLPDLKTHQNEYYEQLFTQVIGQTFLFSKWGKVEKPLKLLRQAFSTEDELFMMFREGSYIMKQEEQCQYIYILFRGSADIIDEKTNTRLCTIPESILPFVVGEEGVFSDAWSPAFSVRAIAPCYVLPIKKSMLWEITNKNWIFTDVMDPYWNTLRRRWQDRLKDPKYLFIRKSSFAAYIQLDVIFTWIFISRSFNHMEGEQTYEMAKAGNELLFKMHEHLPLRNIEENHFLILRGHFHLIRQSQLKERTGTLREDTKPLQTIQAPAVIKRQRLSYPEPLLLYAGDHVVAIQLRELSKFGRILRQNGLI